MDHTQLKPFATWEDIEKLCEEAIAYRTASLCAAACLYQAIADKYRGTDQYLHCGRVPLGYSVTVPSWRKSEKLSVHAIEIDMVVNISDVKNHLCDKVEEEIRTLKQACGGHILKVIIETCFLTEEEKIAMCRAVTNAGADYIKTSTKFWQRRRYD